MNGESRIGCRELLVGAGAGMGGLALGALVAPTAAGAQASGDSGSGLLGGWLIVHKSPVSDPNGTQAVVTYAAGGALATIDINPSPGTNGQGTWTANGSDGFEGTFWSAAGGPPGSPPATVRVHIHGTFTDDGHISGRFSAVVFSGGHQVATDQGTFSGNRITT